MTIISAAGLTIDFRRTPLHEALTAVGDDQRRRIQPAIASMFAGETINQTEQRAVMHTALRDMASPTTVFAEQAQPVYDRFLSTAESIRSGEWRGFSGQPVKTVINIGIGGSDLGPRFICDGLRAPSGVHGPVRVFFVANVDPVELSDSLLQCVPESTLIILASKTFTTLETIANGDAAKQWLSDGLGTKDLSRHLIAVSASPDKAVEYGVAEENIFGFWDWVGGRYSLWSAIGMAIAIEHGREAFEQLLAGAREIDQHFREASFDTNVPVLMALLEDYYVNVCDAHSVAVLPYSHRLRFLPDYLQQLCMESNGKSVTMQGQPVSTRTSPIIWGSAGTVGQHSFYQLLHQGTEFVPCDFILPLSLGLDAADERENHLVSNCLAQSKALYEGKSYEQARQEMLNAGEGDQQASALAHHRQVVGGKPNTIIGLPNLQAKSLGSLLALYEHKVFVQSILWQINAFDQWGVELGKQLSKPIGASLNARQTANGQSEPARIDEVTDYWLDLLVK